MEYLLLYINGIVVVKYNGVFVAIYKWSTMIVGATEKQADWRSLETEKNYNDNIQRSDQVIIFKRSLNWNLL